MSSVRRSKSSASSSRDSLISPMSKRSSATATASSARLLSWFVTSLRMSPHASRTALVATPASSSIGRHRLGDAAELCVIQFVGNEEGPEIGGSPIGSSSHKPTSVPRSLPSSARTHRPPRLLRLSLHRKHRKMLRATSKHLIRMPRHSFVETYMPRPIMGGVFCDRIFMNFNHRIYTDDAQGTMIAHAQRTQRDRNDRARRP